MLPQVGQRPFGNPKRRNSRGCYGYQSGGESAHPTRRITTVGALPTCGYGAWRRILALGQITGAKSDPWG